MKRNRNPAYATSVFINCPFDDEYVPIFHAITFAIRFARFVPRSALETNDSGQERLQKILDIIEECRLGIHDVSRVEADGAAPGALPRFNMPFECGLFFGAHRFGSKEQQQKQQLILDSVPFRFHQTLSDIGGKDPVAHANSPEEAIGCIRRFLADKTEGLPGEGVIVQQYRNFQAELPAMLREIGVAESEIRKASYWRDYVKIIGTYLDKKAKVIAAQVKAAEGGE
jgi:hypothetical protein